MTSLSVTFRGERLPVEQIGEAWCVQFAGGWYFLTASDEPMLVARSYVGKLPRNSAWPRTPAWIASQHYPLVLSIDGVIVRAWPALPPRDDPPKTYEHPYWGYRTVALGKQPVWMFAARGREASVGGNADGDHTVADVEQLARTWLRAT